MAYVTLGKHGDLNAFDIGTPGDPDTKLLWTIDDDGAHFVRELMKWDSSRGFASDTNMSDRAYFAGQAWRTGHNEITINAISGAFGYNKLIAKKLSGVALDNYRLDTQKRYDLSVTYFKKLGLNVNQLPLSLQY